MAITLKPLNVVGNLHEAITNKTPRAAAKPPARKEKRKMKRNGYEECYKKVKAARTANPVNTAELENIRDFYGYDLYIECLKDVIKTYNLD